MCNVRARSCLRALYVPIDNVVDHFVRVESAFANTKQQTRQRTHTMLYRISKTTAAASARRRIPWYTSTFCTRQPDTNLKDWIKPDQPMKRM